ncbi:putative GEL1 protein-1 [Coleophoma cylindrospora]|uniref:1,3-beta-glucanosyltransferase n=1 Tax=Coleophoma cylindrospora TaxID=1849047 RepID=A0A3D8SRM8_9HELO|nr:putative GEL1 protein-1 [Coleophoma cylindrospora]
MMQKISIAALTAALLASPVAAGTPVLKERATSTLSPITITGNAFYNGTDRFYIRGVDYQPGGGTGTTTDPISDATTCKRDVQYFSELGINTIRVYTVDNTANHDECMAALEAAGIYLVLDTDTPLYSLNRNEPQESYNSVYLQSVFATIDAFANYTNTMAFLSGNEVINDANNTDCAPYIKAVTRDMKQYIGDRGYRSIPVGYSAADVSSNQFLMAEYMNCGTSDARGDFYAINDYSWCDPSSMTTSGWDILVQNYTGYGAPVFMSEFGCITNTRNFGEVAALYSTEMTGVFSGGLVYEYSEEGNGYGLVTISGSSVTTASGFNYLKSAYASVANPTGLGGATTSTASSECPTSNAEWAVSGSTLPAIPTSAAAYMSTGAGTGPGLDGSGSQDAGSSDNESPGTATAGSGEVTATGTSGSASSTSTSTSKSSASSLAPPPDMAAFSFLLITVVGFVGGIMAL